MKKYKLIPTILVVSLLLGSCNTSVNSDNELVEQQNKEITIAQLGSELANSEENSINHTE